MNEPEYPMCLVLDVPLKDFKPGQKLCFRRMLPGGFAFTMAAEFIAIERGLVKVKPVPPWQPNYFRTIDIQRMFPDGITRVRASSCFLWGKSRVESWRDHNVCHWFKDTKTPIF